MDKPSAMGMKPRARWLGAVTGIVWFAAASYGASAEPVIHERSPADIPTRDGRSLAADIYLPGETGSWPVILIQTPYGKGAFEAAFVSPFARDPLLKSPNYAFVVVDRRGTGESSDAHYDGSPTKGEDGYDIVEWIAAQSWCDGSVGTWGASALGNVQFATAAEQPPHLKACVPMVHNYREWFNLYYPGGVYYRNRNEFAIATFGADALRRHPLYDPFWRVVETNTGIADTIHVPMLHVTGWYDHQTDFTIREMLRLQSEGGVGAAGRQRLLIGPWAHDRVDQRVQGALAYPAAQEAASREALDFFDHYVRGIENGYESRPAVRYFRMNADTWLSANTWPPGDLATQIYFLQSDGSLSPTQPSKPSAELSYRSDPADPVPTLFGAVVTEETAQQGPGDLRPIESRDDVLAFTTPVFEHAIDIEGRAVADLWIRCDAVDTDISVRLTQVYPDGRSMLLVDATQRASMRNGNGSRQFLQPGVAFSIAVELPSVAVTIPPGHQLRVLVAPSNFDRYDVNPQDGSFFSDATGVTLTPATIRLLTNSEFPSRIELPITGASTGCNANGKCDPGENCLTCSTDCVSRVAGCGNDVCEPDLGEDCLACPGDCRGWQSGFVWSQFCCGDGDGISPVGCADVRCVSDGFACAAGRLNPYCCGDGICADGEPVCDCPVDCGPPPLREIPGETCDDGADNDCDGFMDCDDPDGDCAADATCVAAVCGNGRCQPGENCHTCPTDCLGSQIGRKTWGYCCGDGRRDRAEGDGGICDGNY